MKSVSVLYEDDYLIAVNKPARVASVPDSNVKLRESLMGIVEDLYKDKGVKPYLLHRLDKETSGLILFGKFPRDREVLEGILQAEGTHKKYLALVIGQPHGKVITKKLSARSGQVKVEAQTLYKVVQVFRGKVPLCTLVEAQIETGRKHQIRQHFASIGHPIILDNRYGDQAFNRKFRIHYRLGRQFLHSFSLDFFHPLLKKQIHIEAPMTMDLLSTLKKLEQAK